MGKTLKKIILTMVFLTLAVALVYGADMLDISNEKIELIDDTYYIYKLEEKITLIGLQEEINGLNYEIENLFLDCTYCVFIIGKPGLECFEDCENYGSPITDSLERDLTYKIKAKEKLLEELKVVKP